MKFVAWWQIVCGTLGLGMFAAYYYDVVPHGRAYIDSTMGWINYYLGLGFFSLSVMAGRSLLKNEAWGVWTSLICQAIQGVSLAILNGPEFQINAGPFVGMKLTNTVLDFSAGFSSSFFLGTLQSGPAFILTVNVLALVCAVRLYREVVRRRREWSAA